MEDLPQALRDALHGLPPGLRAHLERVSALARQMAEALGIDGEKAALAGLLHDMARAVPEGELVAEARRRGLPRHPVEERVPVLLHGPVAAARLQGMGISDAEVLEAVRWHSTGAPSLGPVGKVVFLADKLDEGKGGPWRERLRALALRDLDRAILEYLTRDLARLLQKGALLHPASVEFRNTLLGTLFLPHEKGSPG